MTTNMLAPSCVAEEKLSVTTAIIGLLAVGGKAIDTLWDLNSPANQKSNPVFAQALKEIKQCRSTVHVVYKTMALLELAQLPYPERAAWIKADHLIAILTDTVLAMSSLQAFCEMSGQEQLKSAMPPTSSRKDNSTVAEYASLHKKTIEGLCSRIRWHNLSMTMIMTILKCPGESDAQNSRVGLERRMTRLLSANTNLSTRMRQLHDNFDHGQSLLRHSQPGPQPPLFQSPPRLAPYSERTAAVQLTSDDCAATAAGPDGPDDKGRQPLSPLSGYTLADIPILSMIPVPVTTSELTDGTVFYTFSYARRVGRDLGELMQHQTGQGTSRSLGVILGRMNTGVENGASWCSTGSSSNSSDVGRATGAAEVASSPIDDGQTKEKKWKVRSFKVRRRWRV